MVDEITINKGAVLNFFRDTRVQWALTAILLLAILVSSSAIRTSNLDLLKDQTTGEYIPLALDPYYFLRVSETILGTGGNLPETDLMRSPAQGGQPWTGEILSNAVVFLYKSINLFNPEASLEYVNVISPVIFYVIGLIVFFFFSLTLTKSKTASLLASALLAYAPAYLYRTMAGFSDHEAIGMIAVFAFFLLFTLAIRNLEKSRKEILLYSIATGLMTALVLASWGGAVIFVLMVLPATLFLNWLLNGENKENQLMFYFSWLISFILFALLIGVEYSSIIGRLSGSSSILVPFVALFFLIDLVVEKNQKILKFIRRKYEKIYSLAATILIGILGLTVLGRDVFSIFGDIWNRLFKPFGTGRVGLTVAENAQPYLVDWMSQSGKMVFALFIFGAILVGINFAKNVKSSKGKTIFSISWAYMVLSILYSRISSSSILNGENFLSQLFYLSGFLFFGITFFHLYFNKEFEKDSSNILIFITVFFVLLNGRSAVRTFFLITPFVMLVAANFVVKSYNYAKDSKGDLFKLLAWVIFIFALFSSLFSLYAYEESISNQARFTGPSAHGQWQGAMEWVRENTPTDSIFVHWWDYGYWVQTLGDRATVTDGGHAAGNFGDHMIGRYVLTTPNSETAYSFMKSWDVNYLLIDPTDYGKYGAYSKIGSNDQWDRFAPSGGVTGTEDTSQTRETSSEIRRIYTLNNVVDEDIIYNLNGNELFIPGPTYDSLGNPSYKSFIGAVIIETTENTANQPQGVFFVNNQQYSIPIRYLYINGELLDFNQGIDSVVSIIPRISQNGGNLDLNPSGAIIYFSPKIKDGLYAQNYFLDNVFGEYDGLNLVRSEPDQVVSSIRSQGVSVPDIVYYNGLRGPIKIWEVNYPVNTLEKEEFLRKDGEFAEFDNLEFKR